MARFTLAGLAALATLFSLLPSVSAQCAAVAGRGYKPKMAAGYKASVIAAGLRSPRGIALDSAGNLLVAEQQGGSVRRLVLKEEGDQVCVASSTTLVSGGTVRMLGARQERKKVGVCGGERLLGRVSSLQGD